MFFQGVTAMIAYVPCSSCQNVRVATDTAEAPVCLVCRMRETRQGLERELAATFQALNQPVSRVN